MIQWLLHWLGLDDGSGAWYLWWSGIVGDLALLGTFTVLLRRLNCHQGGCWRLGLHHVVGTPYVVCRRHHPGMEDGKPTADHIAAAHAAHVRDSRTARP